MEARIKCLVDWASARGALLHPSVEVYNAPDTGLSFRVKPSTHDPIQPLEPVVQIPASLTLSYLNALTPDPHLKIAGANLSAHVISRLVLIQEFLLGEASSWWGYIQALPQPDDRESWVLPAFWDEDDRSLLDGTNLEVGIATIRKDVQAQYEAVKQSPQIWAGTEGSSAKFTLQLYQWAYCIFSSRSFRPSLVMSEQQKQSLPKGVGVDDFSMLLPLFDIGNHDMTTDVRWHTGQEATCALQVNAILQPGDQIYNNYSMKTNAELLLGYGFMIPATPQLHNDYIHLRKRADGTSAANDEYFVSLRPMADPGSLLLRAKSAVNVREEVPVIGGFRHVQPDMAWDIFKKISEAEDLAELIPVTDEETASARADGRDISQVRVEKLLSGQVADQARDFLEQTVAVIQYKVSQELEKLDETDFEVPEESWPELTRHQRLVIEYRAACRKILEGTMEATEMDVPEAGHE